MYKVLFTALVLGLFATALVGCRVEGEIEDMAHIALPR